MIKGWEFLLAFIAIFLCLAFSLYYFNKARKTESTMTTLRNLNIGFGIMFLFIFISRIIDFPLGDMVNPANNIDLFGLPVANQQLWETFQYLRYDNVLWTFSEGSTTVEIRNWLFVNGFFLTGLAIAVFFMERAFIPKARHVFFLLLIITVAIAFISAFFPIAGHTIDVFEAETSGVSLFFALLGYVSFIVIPIIYFIVAGKTTGDLRRNALLLAFGFIFVLVDIHTVGHTGSGTWYRSVPCLLGFLFIGLGNRS